MKLLFQCVSLKYFFMATSIHPIYNLKGHTWSIKTRENISKDTQTNNTILHIRFLFLSVLFALIKAGKQKSYGQIGFPSPQHATAPSTFTTVINSNSQIACCLSSVTDCLECRHRYLVDNMYHFEKCNRDIDGAGCSHCEFLLACDILTDHCRQALLTSSEQNYHFQQISEAAFIMDGEHFYWWQPLLTFTFLQRWCVTQPLLQIADRCWANEQKPLIYSGCRVWMVAEANTVRSKTMRNHLSWRSRTDKGEQQQTEVIFWACIRTQGTSTSSGIGSFSFLGVLLELCPKPDWLSDRLCQNEPTWKAAIADTCWQAW